MKNVLLILLIVIVTLIIAIIVYNTYVKKSEEPVIGGDVDFLLFSATTNNSGMVNESSDYWKHTDYKLYTNGTVVFSSTYNISGKRDEKTYKIDNEKMNKIIEILDGDFNKYTKDYSATDGETWHLQYYNSKGDVIHEFNGYIYGNKVLEKLVNLLYD